MYSSMQVLDQVLLESIIGKLPEGSVAGDIVKATIEIADKKVTFEGPREFVEAQVAKFTQAESSKQTITELGASLRNSTEEHVQTERDLVNSKKPKGHLETVAVLAFVLAQSGTLEFTEDDIRRAYLRAGVKPPKVVSQALRDAKNRLDYIEIGQKKGTYRLSHHGDRTVRFDLPRS
jgi:hypothetical protein